eukprot:403376012
MKFTIKATIKLTQYYKAKQLLISLNEKISEYQTHLKESQVQYFRYFIAVSYEKSGYYNIAHQLLQQIVDENKDLIEVLTLENLVKLCENESDQKLFRYQVKVLLSLAKLQAYKFDHKKAYSTLSSLKDQLCSPSNEISKQIEKSVHKIRVKILNQLVKYYLSLQLYDKMYDILKEIFQSIEYISIKQKNKLVEMLYLSDLNKQTEYAQNVGTQYQADKLKLQKQDNIDFGFITLKTGLNKFHRFKNQYNCFSRDFLPSSQMSQFELKLHENQLALNKSSGDASDLFISLMQDEAKQMCNLMKNLDPDLLQEYLTKQQNLYKEKKEELGDNNKFMDFLYSTHKFFFFAISEQPIYSPQLVETMITFMGEIAIPFYLNQNFINRNSNFKLVHFCDIIRAEIQKSTDQLDLQKIEEFRNELMNKNLKLDKPDHDLPDLIEIEIALYNPQKLGARQFHDKMELYQKQLAEQMFHGEHYNYIGSIVQIFKTSQVRLFGEKEEEQFKIAFSDKPQILFLLMRELLEFKKRNITFLFSELSHQFVEQIMSNAENQRNFEEYTFWFNELIQIYYKTRNLQKYTLDISKLIDILYSIQKDQECIEKCDEYLYRLDNDKIFQPYRQQDVMSIISIHCHQYLALCHSQYVQKIQHIEKAIEYSDRLKLTNQDIALAEPQFKMIRYNILLDFGKFDSTHTEIALKEIEEAINIAKQHQFKLMYIQADEVKKKLITLQSAQNRSSILQALGVGLLASGMAIGAVLLLTRKKNN